MTSVCTGAVSPLISGTREPRGIPDCCCEHGPQTLCDGAPWAALALEGGGRGGQAHRAGRWAGGAQGLGQGVRASARAATWRAPQPDPHLSDHDRGAGAAAGLAGQPRGHGGGDGVDRGVLEAGLLPAGRRVPVLAAECPASTQRARTQDRRGRCGLDLPAGRAWPGPPELRAAQADPPAARPDPLPQGADP